MFAPDYPVLTERLVLRPLRADDAAAVHAYQSLPDAVRYVPYEPRTRAEVLERVSPPRNASTIAAEGEALFLGVELRESGVLVGDVVFFYRSAEHRTGEIGYIFNPAHAGHGYATEAAQALLRLGFEEFGLHRIVAVTDARNASSIAVLGRLGLRQEAHEVRSEWSAKAGGEWIDVLRFAMLSSEWRSQQTG